MIRAINLEETNLIDSFSHNANGGGNLFAEDVYALTTRRRASCLCLPQPEHQAQHLAPHWRPCLSPATKLGFDTGGSWVVGLMILPSTSPHWQRYQTEINQNTISSLQLKMSLSIFPPTWGDESSITVTIPHTPNDQLKRGKENKEKTCNIMKTLSDKERRLRKEELLFRENWE